MNEETKQKVNQIGDACHANAMLLNRMLASRECREADRAELQRIMGELRQLGAALYRITTEWDQVK